ncbi:MAG: PilW family protein [Gammaproteobacteria bacterium]
MNRNGFSLVELMVALLLGSLIAIAATQLFLVNRQADNLQQGLSAVQDQGRFIFDFLSRDLMQAGHDPLESVQPLIFTGHGGQVSVDGDRDDTLVLQVNGGIDCLGNGSFTGIKKYHVQRNGSNGSLLCTEYEDAAGTWTAKYGNSESLIDNVEGFQVLYGLDYQSLGATGFGQADAYVPAALGDDATQRIVSVRFAVLLASDRRVGFDTARAPASYTLLDRAIGEDQGVDPGDGRLYRVYTSTVALRNQLEE